MARMRSLFAVAGLSIVGVGTGCVSSDRFAAKSMQADQLVATQAATDAQLQSTKALHEQSQAALEKNRAYQESQQALIANQASQIAELTRQNAELKGQYDLAMANFAKGGSSPLPPQLLTELSTFAQQNPDTVEFDEKKGLVKFKSDVTFSAGSDVVKPEAKAVIDRLAGILNGPIASQYEVMVVGHTDNDQVSNPATKKAGHLDNWYLSQHRANAVGRELRTQSVAANRTLVAGVGETRPVAPNDSPANKAKNRRVEVFVMPTMLGGGSSPAPAAPAAPIASTPPAAAPAAKPVQNKDQPPTPATPTADVDRRPTLNK